MYMVLKHDLNLKTKFLSVDLGLFKILLKTLLLCTGAGISIEIRVMVYSEGRRKGGPC